MIMMALACLSLVALLTAAAWAAPVLARPTLPFGVRVPGSHVSDPAVTAQRRRYARAVLVTGAVAAPTSPVAVVLLGSPAMLPATATVLAAAHLALYHAAHRAVVAAKRQGNWYAGARQAVTADTTLRTDPVRLPWPLLIPSVLLLVLTAVTGVWRFGELPATLPTMRGIGVDATTRTATTFATAFSPVITQAALTLLTPLLIAALLRARPELDAAQPAGSARRYRVYLNGMARLLLAVAAGAGWAMFLLALQLWEVAAPSAAVTAATWTPLTAAALSFLVFGVRVGEAGHRLPLRPEEARESGFVQRDDDRHWHLAGMIYANRMDPAILVHQRAGSRWTLNFGNPVAWAVLSILAVLGLLSLLGVLDLPATVTQGLRT
ncbi:DUF1648 domain-containing protein [Nonomuraea terrae]|nr:hypothetical protein [Nonomuraea terrae]